MPIELMGFEPQTSGFESNRYTNSAKTTALDPENLVHFFKAYFLKH